MPFGHRAQNPAGEGNILALRTHVQRIRCGNLEGCYQTSGCSQKKEKGSPAQAADLWGPGDSHVSVELMTGPVLKGREQLMVLL